MFQRSCVFLLFLPMLCLAQTPDTLWTKTYPDQYNDYGMDVAQADDGGFFVLSKGNGVQSDGRVTKIDRDGDIEWVHSSFFGGYRIIPSEMIPLPDNGCIYTGFDAGGTVTVRLDEDGEELWADLFPNTASMYYRYLINCNEGGCAVLSDNSGNLDQMTLIRYSISGNVQWSRTFSDSLVSPMDILRTTDGGFAILLIGGYGEDPSIMRLDRHGDSLWTHTFDLGSHETPYSACLTADGGFAVCGYRRVQEQPLQYSAFIALLDTAALVQSEQLIGDATQRTIMPFCIAPAELDGFLMTGMTTIPPGNQQAIWAAELNSIGDTLWTWKFPGQRGSADGQAIRAVRDGGCIVIGSAILDTTSNDTYVIRIDEYDPPNAVSETPLPLTFTLSQNYPNPFNSSTEISYVLPQAGLVELSIFNALGQKVRTLLQESQAAGEHSLYWDSRDGEGHALGSGLYLCRLTTPNRSAVLKMMLIR